MLVVVRKRDIMLHVSMAVLERKCKQVNATCSYGGTSRKFEIIVHVALKLENVG